jgi:hypothetical protein
MYYVYTQIPCIVSTYLFQHVHMDFTYIYIHTYCVCMRMLQMRATLLAQQLQFKKNPEHLNPQYIRMAADPTEEQFEQALDMLHRDGKDVSLLHAACLAATAGTSLRWNSLQNLRLQDLLMRHLQVGQASLPAVHAHVQVMKGHHNEGVHMTGWLRHLKILRCPDFNTAHLWLKRLYMCEKHASSSTYVYIPTTYLYTCTPQGCLIYTRACTCIN